MNELHQDTKEELLDRIKKSNGVITPRSYFVQVPNSFMRNPNLTMQEKSMYIYLWGFGGENMNAYPSQARMIKELGISRPTIYKILKSLEDKGGLYILNRKYKNEEKTTNLYYLCAINNNDGCFIKDYLNIVKDLYPDKILYI